MSYTVREVSAMLGLSAAQIRSFASKGFLTPERGDRGELRFGFHDLVILRTAGELNAAKIPPRKVRRVLEKLREQLPAGRSITAVRIAADGERVVVRDGDAVEDQRRFGDAIDAYELALTLDPSNADAHYNLAGVYERSGDKAAAVQHLKAYARVKDA